MGAHSSNGSLKSGVLIVGPNPFLLRKKLGAEIPSWVHGTLPGVGFMESMSQFFLPIPLWVFSYLRNVKESMCTFWIACRGNCSGYSISSVCPREEARYRHISATMLDWNHEVYFKSKSWDFELQIFQHVSITKSV